MISLMSRDEMLERLKNGEDPWKIVFDKWKRIKKLCKLHENNNIIIELPIHAFGASCVLCEVHTIESNSISHVHCHGYEKGILPCPLVQIDERCDPNNAWGKFANSPSAKTAHEMIKTLVRARKGFN